MFDDEKHEVKTSAEIKREKKEQKLKQAKRSENEIALLFRSLKTKFAAIEKSGNIPDEGTLRGYRKNLQYVSSGLRKLKRAGVTPSLSQGQLNALIGKLNKWMAGEVAGTGTSKAAKVEDKGLDEILDRIRLGAATVSDPAIQDAIRILREIARERIMSKQAVMVAKRARKLIDQRRKSDTEIENFLKDKFIVPVLSEVFGWFLSELKSGHIHLDQDVRNYIETCVKGGRSRREFINLLLEREAEVQPPSHIASLDF